MARHLRRRWRLALTLLAGIGVYAGVAAFAEVFTDRDWKLSGFEWPQDFVTAALLVCVAPVALGLLRALAGVRPVAPVGELVGSQVARAKPFRPSAQRRSLPADESQQRVVDEFHRLYYDGKAETWKNTRWLGVTVWKNPLDLWIYQELLSAVRPAVIVETGTLYGGSGLFLAEMCELLGHGEVLTIDLESRADRPTHIRLSYLTGSSTSPEILEAVSDFVQGKSPVMVILDSDHTREHVLGELHGYADLVTRGSYLIVEDTNLNGHPVVADFGPGPMEAAREFLRERRDFVADQLQERFLLTFNPGGYLRRL